MTLNITLDVAPSPHVANTSLTTKTIMWDVIIALVPCMIAAVIVFGIPAIVQIAIATISALVFEAVFTKMRGRPVTLLDGSAAITGIIIGMSLPWSAPFYIPIIASLIGIGIGKILFGGLGHNMFNPAMVGRAFVMISFSALLGGGAFVAAEGTGIITQATPLSNAANAAAESGYPSLGALFLGNHNGCLGESSILASLIGGLYLCLRRTAAWEIPASILATVAVLAGLGQLSSDATIANLPALGMTIPQQLLSGALVFGAFFIATDPVSSPLTFQGKVIFGIGVGALTWILRIFSSYPEGFMFAILLMNAFTPLINRGAIPKPVGGTVPQRN